MNHRIVGNISGLVNDKDEVNDNNPVVIQYHYYHDVNEQMHIIDISIYGAYPNLIRNMGHHRLLNQVRDNITNIEGDNIEFETTTVTIL